MQERKFTDSYSTDLLTSGCKSKKSFNALLNYLDPAFLISEAHQEIWEEMKRQHGVSQAVPEISVLLERFDKKNSRGAFDAAITILSEMRLADVDHDQVMGEFETWVKESAFVKLLQDTAEEFQRRDRSKAISKLAEGSKEIHALKVFDGHLESVFGDFDRRQTEREQGRRKGTLIPTGWQLFDEINKGGHWTGELECWLGDSGSGKSKCLVSRGMQSALRGFHVLHVQLEGTEEQAMNNYDAAWSKIAYSDFRMRDFESAEIKKKLTKARKEASKALLAGRGDVYVKTVESFGGMSTIELHALVRETVAKNPEIRHVIVDYAELLVLRGHEGAEHERLIKVMRDLKNIAIEFDVLVTTASQTSDIPLADKENPKFHITRHNIGKSKRIIEPLSYFYTINQTSDEASEAIVRVYCDKLRENRSRQSLKIRQELWRSEFYSKVKTMQLQASVVSEEVKTKARKKKLREVEDVLADVDAFEA